MGYVLFYSLIGGLFSLGGGLLLLWKPSLTQKIIVPLVAFGAGAFLSAALMDILPEALESGSEPHPILLSTLGGFFAFFVLERFLMTHVLKPHASHREHSDHTESLPVLLIAGDSLHNILDGVIIGLAYVANPLLGLPTALAIAAHEVPQEIGDFAVLLKIGWRRRTIVAVNVLQSLLTIPGVLIGYSVGQSVEQYLPTLLGMTAGIFLYIAGSDLIPEIHHKAGHTYFLRAVIPTLLGIVTLSYLRTLTH